MRHHGRGAAAAAALAATVVLAGVATAHPDGDGQDGGSGGGGGFVPSATPNADGRFLPDLLPVLPGRVHVATRRSSRGTRTLLTFASAAKNAGTGPLRISAARPSRSVPTMSATQVVRRSDGAGERFPGVGTLRFYSSRDHRHWHLLDFMRYELRDRSGGPLRRDRKVGFCLGDRYEVDPAVRLPGEPSHAIYRSRCGLSRPDLLSLVQGISVGYGDIYPARLEGQYVDITGLPTGRYLLTVRVNPAGRLMDAHADNDFGSMLVAIRRRGSGTRAVIRDWCFASETCPAG